MRVPSLSGGVKFRPHHPKTPGPRVHVLAYRPSADVHLRHFHPQSQSHQSIHAPHSLLRKLIPHRRPSLVPPRSRHHLHHFHPHHPRHFPPNSPLSYLSPLLELPILETAIYNSMTQHSDI